ncbi:MAG TPA: hypothetical protein VFR18_14285 [Terriglobia bacterium]|nr:hypothetical protein [Terriglobia bacterium]
MQPNTDNSGEHSATGCPPVLFLVFNRPDLTIRVFEAIRKARPDRLYVAADGPRASHADERAKCEATRALATRVDWPCQVKTLFRTDNLGCRRAVSSAIDWFFEHEPEGIVLEDDCLPSTSFFAYCGELLAKYRTDERVWQVCGSRYVPDDIGLEDASYFFSRYGPVWGWASWRRAWKSFDADLKAWPQMREEPTISSAYPDAIEKKAKVRLGDKLYRGEIDTWDYQWGMAKNFNHGLSIVPAKNLILNIGFGQDATHTVTSNKHFPTEQFEIDFPLRPPRFVLPQADHDRIYRSRFIGSGVSDLWPDARKVARSVFGA